MAGYVSGDSVSHHAAVSIAHDRISPDSLSDDGLSQWYMSRKEIEENSPSRRDGIDLKKETYFRKSYCTFLQDLGMRLKVPQVTIATAIIFCHRFFLRHSHAKNDRRSIATVCMFLAGKVEETPRPLKDVIMVSYEIIHKKDPMTAQKIKQKEVYEQQKELILMDERVVLATLAFDLNVHHPYKPLVEAIKKFKVAQNALAQVAWNFVNDGLRTSLCLQFKPHHIAAGAIFLAAKFLKVKLPSDGEKVWWQEFDVTPRQLEEVSNQMLELYEQNKMPQGSEIEGSSGVANNQRGPTRTSTVNGEFPTRNGHTPTGVGSVSSSGKPGMPKQSPSCSGADYADNYNTQSNIETKPEKENGSTEFSSVITEHKFDVDAKNELHAGLSHKGQAVEASNVSKANKDKSLDDRRGNDVIKTGFKTEMEKSVDDRTGHGSIKTESNMEMEKSADDRRVHDDIKIESKVEMDKSLDDRRVHDVVKTESPEAGELKEPSVIPKPFGGQRKESSKGPDGQSPQFSVMKFDMNKLKAAVEKKKKSRLDIPRKKDVIDEDDLIERALEDGVELAIKDERIKQERRQSWPKDDTHHDSKDNDPYDISNGQSSRGTGSTEFVEEGEMLDNPSPRFSGRKRKGSPIDQEHETKHRHEYGTGAGHRRTHHDSREDGHRSGRGGYSHREHRKHT